MMHWPVTNDAFYRLHVAESPLLEPIFNVDEFLGEFIQIKVFQRFAINRKPDIAHHWVRQIGLRKIAIEYLLWHRMAASGEEVKRFIVKAGLAERCRKFGMDETFVRH
jgi:hypothetical protein